MSNKRAVLLGTGAFPLIIKLYLDTFRKWQDEVDVLYIAVDQYTGANTRDYIVNLVKQFPKAVLLENVSPWPESYKDAYKASKEDTFLIMHDDTFIYQKGIVDKYFKIAEEGLVVTQKHEIYSPKAEVDAAINKKYGWTDPSYSFLLYFLFISRENLEKTTINFNGKGWNVGDDIPLLDIKASPTTVGGDTGFLLGLELFDKHVPFHWIPRSETAGLSHADHDIIPLLIQKMKDKENPFKEGWVHLQNTGNSIPSWFTADLDARIWYKHLEEPRLAWMWEMMQNGGFDEIPEFRDRAKAIFESVRVRCGIDMERIQTISNIFHILLYENN